MRTVLHIVRESTDVPDDLGNIETRYADPVERKVRGWGPVGSSRPVGSSTEPVAVGLERVVVDLAVYPAGWKAAPHDRLVIDGELYEVEGRTEDWDNGPFGSRLGYVINCRHVDA